MLTHSQIWAAIDALAEREGLSPSSLAKRAGLDPTTFNRSKRKNAEGQLRWPSTESIAKVLAATGASVDDFLHATSAAAAKPPVEPAASRIAFRVLESTSVAWFDPHGKPTGAGWEEIAYPESNAGTRYALGVRGQAFAPVYRDGDTVILAPEAQCRTGDRVFVLDCAGKASFETLRHQSATHMHSTALGGTKPVSRLLRDVKVVARIIWVSQ